MPPLLFLLILLQNVERIIDRDPVIRVLPQDAISAIDHPVFVSASNAPFMKDDEPVIGLGDGQTWKAYSTWFLDGHEIVNDTIGQTPIAVTWCPLCYSGIVYVRQVGQRIATFGVTGMLWRENLVMYDRETRSWWAQATGRGLKGRAKG